MDTPDLSSPTLMWDKTGRMFKFTLNVSEVTNADEILAKAAAPVAQRVVRLAPARYLAVFADSYCIATRVPSVWLRCGFTLVKLSDKPVLMATPEVPTAPAMALEYMVPDLYFVTRFHSDGVTHYQAVVNPSASRTYKLPLPNTFGDGKLCLGQDYVKTGDNCSEIHDHAIKTWNESAMNTDLFDKKAGFRNLFTFDAGTLLQVPTIGDMFFAQCDIISNVFTNWLTQTARAL